MQVAGIILAGGQSRRMQGRDKALMTFGDGRLIDTIHRRLSRQVQTIALNSNSDGAQFSGLDVPVIPDDIGGFAGPLAGILAAMEWAAARPALFSHIVTVATDTPYFPDDLVETLRQSIAAAPEHIGVAASGGRLHPVFGIWPVSLRGNLRDWLNDERNRRVVSWIETHPHEIADFPMVMTQSGLPFDPFFNINTPEDAVEARQKWTFP